MRVNISSTKDHPINFDSILLYLAIFFSGDTYLCGTNSNGRILTFARFMLVPVCLIILFRLGFRLRISKNKSKLISYAVMVIAFIFIAFVNNDNFNRAGLKLLCMTVAILVCLLMSFDDFAKNYNSVLYFIAITAIAFTFIAYILPGIVRSFPSIVNTAGATIYTCGFAGLLDGFVGTALVRTQGIFWEPGVFQMYLNLALAFELMYMEQVNRKHVVAYLIAIVLTFSTTGYIVTAWVMVSYVFLKKNGEKQNASKKFFAAMFIFIMAVVLVQFTQIGDAIFGKIYDRSNTNFGSMTTRLAGILVSIELALLNPWHGVGMTNMSEHFLRLALASKDILGGWTHDNTNTLFYQFAVHGIPYGMIFLIGTLKFGNNFQNGKKIFALAVFIMMFLMYVGENLQYSIFPYLIVFYGYGWKEERQREHAIVDSV